LRRNFLLKHVIEGKIEVTGGRGRRHRQLWNDLKGRRYIKFKEEALDRTVWRIRFERGYGTVIRRTAE
jgi:hypothetical protein